MHIYRIIVNRTGNIKVFHSYLEFITRRTEYWAANHEPSYQRLLTHLSIVDQQEKALEVLYRLPRGSLEGAHLVYGSGRDMREAVRDENTRTALLDGTLRFVIRITADTRNVEVCTMDQYNDLKTFRMYRLGHNLYGVAIMEDPIVSVG